MGTSSRTIGLLIVFTILLSPTTAWALESEGVTAPVYDPFKVLIEKPKPEKPAVPYPPTPPTPRPVAPPPLRLKVHAITGEGRLYVAMINYGGDDHIVEQGWQSKDGNVIVRSISADKVEVYHRRAKSLETFTY